MPGLSHSMSYGNRHGKRADIAQARTYATTEGRPAIPKPLVSYQLYALFQIVSCVDHDFVTFVQISEDLCDIG